MTGSGPWRVGRKLGRTLYVDDHVVGMVDTPELAARIVAAMNGVTPALNRSCCGGTLHALLLDMAEADDLGVRACTPFLQGWIDGYTDTRPPQETKPVAGVEVGTVLALDLDAVRNGHVPWPGDADDGTCSCCGMPHPCVTRRLADEVGALRAAAHIGTELDNHHNAAICRYCKGITDAELGLREKAEAQVAELTAALAAARGRECTALCGDIERDRDLYEAQVAAARALTHADDCCARGCIADRGPCCGSRRCTCYLKKILAALDGAVPPPAAPCPVHGPPCTFDPHKEFGSQAVPPPPAAPTHAVAELEHRRLWAGHGADRGRDTGAYCEACSADEHDYIWPCRLLGRAAAPTHEFDPEPRYGLCCGAGYGLGWACGLPASDPVHGGDRG